MTELLEKEAFNFALFQHNPLPMTVVDGNGNTLKSNLAQRHAARSLPRLGGPMFDPSEGEGERMMCGALMQCIASGRVGRFPEQALGGRLYSITIAPLPGGAVVITEDITERKRAEEEARSQREQLIQAQKMATIGTLVSGVAHEVSNPNNVVMLSAAGLHKSLENVFATLKELKEEGHELEIGGVPYEQVCSELLEQADLIARGADRIHAMVRELKEFARQEDADLLRPVDLNKVAANAVRLLGPIIRKATERFRTDYAKDLPLVEGNAQRLEQVIVNLISNACQALESKDARVCIQTAFDRGKGRVEVRVQDEGRGIPPENLDRVRDPFFTTRHDSGGTGLGLSVCDKIVKSHGGELTFMSTPGLGSCVTVSLPRAPVSGAADGESS